MSQPIKSRTKASSTNGIKKSSARRPTPAFTVYRDEPEQPVLVAPTAAHLDPAQVFIPGNSGRHSPTLFTKKGRESIKAMKQAGRTNALPLPNLPALNKHTTVTDKKRKSRRFLNPRIAGDEIDIDMMDMEGFSDVSSWGSATSNSSVLSTPPKRRTLVTSTTVGFVGGPPTPDSPTFAAPGYLPTAPHRDYDMKCVSPNMFSSD